MKVIDSHLHLDAMTYPSLDDAAAALSAELVAQKVDKGLVLHLEVQPWSAEDVGKVIAKSPLLESFVNIDPRALDAKEQLAKAIKIMGFCGLKLHPRLQQLDMLSEDFIDLTAYAGELQIPILIDAFPDGDGLMQGFNPLDYAKVAKRCPDTQFIWAHMGGHHVIDMMMLAKRLSNVHFDCSYSLLYYRGSSVPKDMVYAMNSMGFDRIFYGSDYPDRSIGETLNSSLSLLRELGVTELQLEKIMYKNFKEFMQW